MPRKGEYKEIDKAQFEKLCEMQCTEIEIMGWFGVEDDTLNSWCKRTYDGKCFSDVFKEKRSGGRCSLRRKQWQLAEKNATMGIWLGKQYLGQSDNPTVDEAQDATDPLSNSLQEMAEELQSDQR